MGRRAIVASSAAILLGIARLGSQPAAADQLQDFARQCDQAIGVTVPDFDCDAGTEVPAQGSVFSGPQRTVTCDEPNRLNRQCDPGSRFQVLTRSDTAYVVAHCRKEGGDAGMYGDIAVIQYSRKNGATCFYQAIGNQEHGNMPGGSSAPNAPAKPVIAPSTGLAPNSFWLPPHGAFHISCAACHDNGPFIRSPYINGVMGVNKLPGSDDFSFNSDQPYAFVGDVFSTWKAYKVEVAGNECNACHRLGVSNVFFNEAIPEGTGRDFALRATSAHEDSKNPPSASSPIWMPPLPVQTQFSAMHHASAQAIHNCVAQFDPANPANLPNTDACRITLFAQAYNPSSGPPGPPIVTSVSPIAGQCTGATDITIMGSNFSGATSVVAAPASNNGFAPLPLQNLSVAANKITATVPANIRPDLYEIVVTTPLGSSVQPVLSARTDLFSVGPIVTGISPNQGSVAGQTAVTITGSCFDFPGLSQNFVKVFFGGAEAAKGFDQCASASQCVAFSPPAAGVAQVDVVVNVWGAQSAATPVDRFSYTGPFIASLQPNHGPKTGGTSVEISGGGFPPHNVPGNNMIVDFGAVEVGALCLGSTVEATTSCSTFTPQVANAGPVQVAAVAFGTTSPPSPASVFTFEEFPALTQFLGQDLAGPPAIFLNGNAPAGGAAVLIMSSDSNVVRSQQPVVRIPAGAQSISVPLVQFPSPVAKQVTLTATYQGSSASAVFNVPASPPLAIYAPAGLGANQADIVRVSINMPAPGGGAQVALSSSDPAAIAVPASNSVTILGGDFSATFPITNLYDGPRKSVTLSASYSGASASAFISVPFSEPVCRPRKCPKGSSWDDQECACVSDRF
jgi:hypothetical protein